MYFPIDHENRRRMMVRELTQNRLRIRIEMARGRSGVGRVYLSGNICRECTITVEIYRGALVPENE